MHRIEKLDTQLISLFSPLNEIAAEIDLPFICDLSDEQKIAEQTYRGIYRIDIQTTGVPRDLDSWIDALRAKWELESFKKSFTPNLKKKRICRHTKLAEWMPLYLGKSENVAKRVLEHLNLSMEKSTYALKLKARPNMAEHVFRLHALELKVKRYDLIAPALEAALRNRFSPLIGKQ